MSVVENPQAWLDNAGFASGVFVDLTKTFNTVDQSIFINSKIWTLWSYSHFKNMVQLLSKKQKTVITVLLQPKQF